MKRRAGLALLLALAGCGSAPTRPVAAVDPAARVALAALDAWHATGRVAVRAGGEGYHVSFDWRQLGGRGELAVRGPFGAGAARISVEPALILIESGRDPPLDLAAPFGAAESALVARLGFPLPLEPLRYWVLGVPAPDLPSTAAGSDFEQSGWRVAVTEYAVVAGAPAPLPARLELRRSSTRIRLVVDHWQVGGR